jgi:VCBS repeat-containing protein
MKKQHSLSTGRYDGQRNVSPSRNARRKCNRRPQGLGARFEPLEARHVLAANVLASAVRSIDVAGGEETIEMNIDLPSSSATTQAILMIQATPSSGSLFDPAAAIIRDSNGNTITPMSAVDDMGGRTSMTTVSLVEGDYTLVFKGDGGDATTGSFDISISLLGDTMAASSSAVNGRVDSLEEARASAALVQALGTGNFVTAQFYQSLGISLAESQFNSGFDANGNGSMDPSDLDAVEHNGNIGRVNVTLVSDDAAPVITNFELDQDTGASATDNITTNGTLTATIADDSALGSLLLGFGTSTPSFNILGDFNEANDTLTISQARLQEANGGTLPTGEYTVRLLATDSLGNAMAQPVSVTFKLLNPNNAPTSTAIGNQTATEDQAFTLSVANRFTDANLPTDVLTFTATRSDGTALPTWLTFNAATQTFTGTPTNSDVGVLNIRVTAADSQNTATSASSTSQTFQLTVVNVNDAPTVSTIPNQTAPEQSNFNLNVSNFFSDSDVGDVLTFAAQRTGAVTTLPAWLSFNTNSGVFSGIPDDTDVGVSTIQVTATDSGGLSVSTTFTLTVTNVNDNPESTDIPAQTVSQGTAFTLDVSGNFTDDDPGDVLTLTATRADNSALPAWLSFNAATGVFSGTPGNSDVGTVSIRVTATDLGNASATETFNITVQNVNDAPVINDQVFSISENATNNTVVGTVLASDIDAGDTLTFSLLAGADGGRFSIAAGTGILTLVDASGLIEGSTLTVNVQVQDAGGLNDSAVITVNVSQNSPAVAVDDSGFTTDDRDTLNITAASLLANDTDAEGDSFSIISVSGTSANGATVTLNGTAITYDPTAADTLIELHGGENLNDTFTYTIQDQLGRTSTATVTVNVDGTDDVRFRMFATDAQGNEITQIGTGQDFNLVVTVEDVRPEPRSVFSAYLDIVYPANLITLDGAIEHINPYTGGTGAGSNITTTPGIIDEAGAVSFNFALTGENEVLSVPFTAGSTPGTVQFSGNETEDQVQHPVLVVGLSQNVDPRKVDFGALTLTITGTAGAAGIAVARPQHNTSNPLDVNNDGNVSPLDALHVLNALSDATSAGTGFVDVNNDSLVTPIDALLVINGLESTVSSAPQAAMSAGAVRAASSNSAATQASSTSVVGIVAPSTTSVDSAMESLIAPVAGSFGPSTNADAQSLHVNAANNASSSSQSAVSHDAEEESVDTIFAALGGEALLDI